MRFTKAIQLMHRPLLMRPEDAHGIASHFLAMDPRQLATPSRFAALGRKLGIDRAGAFDDDVEALPTRPAAYAPWWMGEPDARLANGWCVKDGVGTMKISGPLLDHGGPVGECYEWFDGYDTIAQSLAEFDADPTMKGGIVFGDTPGGVVSSGIYELAKQIRARGPDAKPLWFHAEMAASAGYWIASQFPRVLAGEAGIIGSIGVVIVHENYAEALKGAGIAITSIEFPKGAFKTDGAWWKAMSEEGQAALQSDIDMLGAAFLATVEAGRGSKLSGEKAKGFGAQVFPAVQSDKARDALALGLIDGVMSEQQAFEEMKAAIATPTIIPFPASAGSLAARAASKKPAASAGATPEKTMKTRAEKDAAIALVFAGKTSASTDSEKLDAIREIVNEPTDEEVEEGDEEEVVAEDEDEEEPAASGRKPKPVAKSASVDPVVAQAILNLPEAKGREALAQRLAFKPGMTVDEAKADLLASPKKSSFVDRVEDPKLSADGGPAPTEAQKSRQAAFSNAGVRMRKRG